MPVRVATLSVFANPWSYIDEHGRPMGVVMVDVNNHVAERRWVGTRLGAEQLQKATTHVVAGREHETVPARHKLHLEVERDEQGAPAPVVVPNTPYYCERIRAGELFPADAKTASVAGLQKFVPVAQAEAAARTAALAEFDAQNGAGAAAELNGGEQAPAFFASVGGASASPIASSTEPEPRAEKAAPTTKKGDS